MVLRLGTTEIMMVFTLPVFSSLTVFGALVLSLLASFRKRPLLFFVAGFVSTMFLASAVRDLLPVALLARLKKLPRSAAFSAAA